MGKFTRPDQGDDVLVVADRTLSGLDEIATHMHRQTSSHALQDHYAPWGASGEKRDRGKLLLIDPAAPVRSIFFDDNAQGTEDTNIIDVRVKEDGQWRPMRDEEARDIHFVHTNPEQALLDEEYYIKETKRVLGIE